MSTQRPIHHVIHMLLKIFLEHCTDVKTMSELQAVTASPVRWLDANKLFLEVRAKSIAASKSGDKALEVQFAFEEVCAKTLYNLTYPSVPFDADSKDKVVPYAIALAKSLNVSLNDVFESFEPPLEAKNEVKTTPVRRSVASTIFEVLFILIAFMFFAVLVLVLLFQWLANNISFSAPS